MLHTKFQGHRPFRSGEEYCLRFLPYVGKPAPIAQVVECPHQGTGGHGFDPGPQHTKVVYH